MEKKLYFLEVVFRHHWRIILQPKHCRTVRKICQLDEHVLMAFAGLNTRLYTTHVPNQKYPTCTYLPLPGLTADARVLIKQARVECQSHKLTVEDPVTLEYITRFGKNGDFTRNGVD